MTTRKVKYTDEQIGKLKIISDILPKPGDLVLKEETIKVTLSLTTDSVNFFKETADKHQAHYQQMIRKLLDEYAAYHRRKNTH